MFIPSEQEFNDFNTAVSMVVNLLILQDKDLIIKCEQILINLLGAEETAHIMNAAMFLLAETKADIFHWTWRNFPHFHMCSDLNQDIAMFIVKTLIAKGFVLGEDFSSTVHGTILTNNKAKAALYRHCSSREWVFIEEVLEVA